MSDEDTRRFSDLFREHGERIARLEKRSRVAAERSQRGGVEFPPMPPHIRERVERRLDRIARELLAEELDPDDPDSATAT
jgi:hypothetical protein